MKSLIIIGPSGVGKSTIIKTLIKKYDIFQFVMSYTTRAARINEVDGLHYHFVNYQNFSYRKDHNELLEAKKVFNYYYGTSKASYMNILAKNKIPLLDIDIEGMIEIKNNLAKERQRGNNLIDPEVLCILPPSWSILGQRLKNRGTQVHQVVNQRMIENRAQVEKMMGLKGQDNMHFVTNYQYQLTIYGIQLFLSNKFQQFHNVYCKSQEKQINRNRCFTQKE